jgi:hypothetical protein
VKVCDSPQATAKDSYQRDASLSKPKARTNEKPRANGLKKRAYHLNVLLRIREGEVRPHPRPRWRLPSPDKFPSRIQALAFVLDIWVTTFRNNLTFNLHAHRTREIRGHRTRQRGTGDTASGPSLTCICETTPAIGAYAIDDDFDEARTYKTRFLQKMRRHQIPKRCVAAVRVVESKIQWAQISSLPV